VKLTNLTITPKLGILVGVTLIGLCIAGILAGYLMKQEMLDARIEQTKAIVEMGRNMAAGLQKDVEAGKLTKEAAIAEFGRRANAMTYDKGAGYLFGTNYDGITVLAPDPKQVGTNRMDVVTNGRKNVDAANDKVMPAFASNVNVMCFIDDIYVYLRARANNAIPGGRPPNHEDKPQAAKEAEASCTGIK